MPVERQADSGARAAGGEQEGVRRQIDLRLTEQDILRDLDSVREILENHLISDHVLSDGRTVRQIFYDLVDIAMFALSDARRRAREGA
jgi:hypothetical protein